MTRARAPSFSCRQGAIIVALALLHCALVLGPAPAGAREASPARRVLSLGPALTEMVFAVGGGDRLVGRTTFCNHPAAATKLPAVGGATGWNEELVVSLRPDLILALEGRTAEVARLARLAGARLEVLPTQQLADVWRNMTRIGELVGEPARARASSRPSMPWPRPCAPDQGARRGVGFGFSTLSQTPFATWVVYGLPIPS